MFFVPKMNDAAALNEDEDTENQQNSKQPLNYKPAKGIKFETTSNTSFSALSLTSKVSGGRLSNWIHKPRNNKKGKFEEVTNLPTLPSPQTICSSSYSETGNGSKFELKTQKSSVNKLVGKRKGASKSKIPLRKPKMKSNKRDLIDEEAETLLSSKTYRKSPWFFRKFKSGPTNRSISTVSSSSSEPGTQLAPQSVTSASGIQTNSFIHAENGICLQPNLSKEITDTDDSCVKSCSSLTNPHFRSYIMAQSHLDYDINLTDALREITELAAQLQEDETHLAHIISKYIQDHSLENELLKALSNHAKLHLDVQRRAQKLASEMWTQQSEIMKYKDTELQENLVILVKENRKLQEEIENLTKKNEKLSIRFHQFPERRGLLVSSHHLLENLSKNNDKLRYKASGMSAQIQEQEKDVRKLQRKCQSLEQQLRNCNSQIQNYKAILRRIQTDNELEHTHLSQRIQTNEMTIKESVEAGDVLLEDLDGLKRQLKSMPCSLNWTKLKSRGNSLPDLIYMCRSCINELAKAMIASQTDNMLKEKDNSTLRDELLRMEKTLEAGKSEQERLSGQLESYKTQQLEAKTNSSKCLKLERDFSEYKQRMDQMVEGLEKEKATLVASFDDMDVLNRQVIEKEEELSLNKEKMYQYKSENDALRMQLHGLKQVLNASGTGDVARELADTQEKLTFFQSQYYQLLSEKNYLIEQLQSANVERGALNDFQNSYYQFIQAQRQDLEVLTKDNSTLKQQIEAERNHVTALRTERNKFREEKAVMKEIYHQLKNEINKVQQLEGEVVGMNMEANRLAIIAEYNKQLGEKLQCEVADRDVKISELQNIMEELNMAQMENVKDKVALCVELTEVCGINDKLNYSLVNEQQKAVHLDKTKKKIEDAANSQLKAVEEMQTVERAALRELLQDFKNIVKQRDNLLISQNEYIQQISNLRANSALHSKNLEHIKEEQVENLKTLASLEEKLKETEKELCTAHGEIVKYVNNNSKQKAEYGQLKSHNETLDSSIKYLQNTLQKLHNDLNESRKTEVETKMELEKQNHKEHELKSILEQDKINLINISEENHKLTQQISMFNQAYEELLAKFQMSVESASEENDCLKKELQEANTVIQKHTESIEHLENAFTEKETEVIEMHQYCDGLAEQLKETEASAEDIDLQSKLLSESNSIQVRLQDALTRLRGENEELTKTTEDLQVQCSQYKNYIEEIMREYSLQKIEMETDLHKLSQKVQDLNNEYTKEKDIHTKLLASHKDLAAKLLKSVRMLIDEKLSRKGAEASITSLSQTNLRLSSEKAVAENTIALLSEELKNLRTKFEDLTADKNGIPSVLCDLQELQKQNQCRFQPSEQEVYKIRRGSGIHVKESKSKLDIFIEESTKQLKEDLDISHRKIIELTIEISNLKQELTVMEFQKSEVVLRLHETQAKLKTEENINKDLMETNQNFLDEILNMENTGKIAQPVSEALLQIIQGHGQECFEMGK